VVFIVLGLVAYMTMRGFLGDHESKHHW
jgi:hypothetical protein